jgi:hypothetical protein
MWKEGIVHGTDDDAGKGKRVNRCWKARLKKGSLKADGVLFSLSSYIFSLYNNLGPCPSASYFLAYTGQSLMEAGRRIRGMVNHYENRSTKPIAARRLRRKTAPTLLLHDKAILANSMKRCWRGVQISHLQLRIAMKRRSSVGATF